MIKIEKPDSSIVNITIKSEDGICPFCNGTGCMAIDPNSMYPCEASPTKFSVKCHIKCEWCEGTGKRA